MGSETIVFVGEALGRPRFPRGHPLDLDRQGAFWSEAVTRGLQERVAMGTPRMATREELERFGYTAAVHAQVTRDLRELAEEACGGRLLAFGGGGYDLGNVAAAWTSVLAALV